MKCLRKILHTRKKRAGFTLVELMIVVVIVAILAAAAVPIYRFAVRKAYMSEAKAALGTIRAAELVYHAEHEDFLPVNYNKIGNKETEPVAADRGLGIDVTKNTWFNEPNAFGIGVHSDTDLDLDTFLAFCDGERLAGSQPATVKTIRIGLWQDGTFIELETGDTIPYPT